MRITTAQVEALRDLLSGDLAAYEQRDRNQFADGHGGEALFASALIELVRQQFGSTHTHGDIVRFVAAMRARQPDLAKHIDTISAERMLQAALGNTSAIDGMSAEQKIDVQVGLLVAFVDSESFDNSNLDQLLFRARLRAEQITDTADSQS